MSLEKQMIRDLETERTLLQVATQIMAAIITKHGISYSEQLEALAIIHAKKLVKEAQKHAQQ